MKQRSAYARPSAPPVRVTYEPANARYSALSSDGKLLAYASDRSGNYDLYVQQVGSDTAVRITSSDFNEVAPSFHSRMDGLSCFQSDQKDAGLQIVPALGGEPRVLASGGSVLEFPPTAVTSPSGLVGREIIWCRQAPEFLCCRFPVVLPERFILSL